MDRNSENQGNGGRSHIPEANQDSITARSGTSVCVCVCVCWYPIYLFICFYIGTLTVVQNQVLSEHMVEVNNQNQGARNPSRSRDGTEGGLVGGDHQRDTGPQNQAPFGPQRGGDVRTVARRIGVSGGGEKGKALGWAGAGQV